MSDDDYDDGSVQCAECDQEAVGYDGGTPLCARCYRAQAMRHRPLAANTHPPSEPDPDDDRADDDDPEATPIVTGDDPDAGDLPEPDIGGEG